MSTQSQITANQANSQLSTGPTSEAGKAVSCKNNFRFGFTGAFTVLPWEDELDFESLRTGLLAEHKPTTQTERLLVDGMAEHYWLKQRAITLQNKCLTMLSPPEREKELALYLRYQTTNDRAFYKSLNQLLSLRAEKRKQQIGFESQKRQEAEELRREADEKRKEKKHKMQIWLLQAEGEHREMKNNELDPFETDPRTRVDRILAHEKAA